MRASVVAALLLLIVLGLGIRSLRSPSESGPADVARLFNASKPKKVLRPAPQPLVPGRLPDYTAQGEFKSSVEEARLSALAVAQRQIGDYLLSRRHGPRWEPPMAYISEHLITSSREERHTPEMLEKYKDDPSGPLMAEMRRVTLEVRVTEDLLTEALRGERESRVQSRAAELLRLLAVAVVCLGAIGLYVRFDDLTKGYYTGWLRGLTLMIVALAGSSLWW